MFIYLSASSAPNSMEVDGEGGGAVDFSSLQQLFSREYTHLYLKMADTARLQNNYAVAKRYLQLTEAAVGEVRTLKNFQFVIRVRKIIICKCSSDITKCLTFWIALLHNNY